LACGENMGGSMGHPVRLRGGVGSTFSQEK
jgi:hypothetical protein